MPKVSDVFPVHSSAARISHGPRDITLGAWRTEYSFGKTDYVFDLVDKSVALRCGPQLMREIAAALNEDDFDLWPGRAVTVYGKGETITDKDTGERRDVIAIHAMASKLDKPPAMARQREAVGGASDMDDDIPF